MFKKIVGFYLILYISLLFCFCCVSFCDGCCGCLGSSCVYGTIALVLNLFESYVSCYGYRCGAYPSGYGVHTGTLGLNN